MDPLTQGLLGATIGQAIYGRRIGRGALVWGAAGGMLPDVDVVAMATGPMGEFLWHRGPTHSLWFGPVVGTLLGVWLWRRARTRGRPGSRGDWIGLMVLAIFTHPLLDAFTTYGTQLLSPFSNRRFAWDGVAIIDPFYTLLLAAAVLVGWRRGWGTASGRAAAWAALGLSTAFLFYGVWLNRAAEARAREQLALEDAAGAEVRAYPTLLQPWLRRVVARDADRILVGWISLWQPRSIEWEAFTPDSGPAVAAVRATREGRIFEWFAMGQTAARVLETDAGSVIEIDDLRYGLPQTPRDGLWALRAEVRDDGTLAAPPFRINRERPAPPQALLEQIVLRTFGG